MAGHGETDHAEQSNLKNKTVAHLTNTCSAMSTAIGASSAHLRLYDFWPEEGCVDTNDDVGVFDDADD